MTEPVGGEAPTRLDEWLAMHGPLWPASALMLALDLCVAASAMRTPDLRQRVGSLHAGAIVRRQSGEWVWRPSEQPAMSGSKAALEAVARIGAILFHCLAGHGLTYPTPAPSELHQLLRRHRPDLPGPIVNLTVMSVSARHRSRSALHGLARDLRAALGERRTPHFVWRRSLAAAVVTVAAAFAMWTWWLLRPDAREMSGGLTRTELAARDVLAESAYALAAVEEHTASLQVLSDIRRLLITRLPATDPRVIWVDTHESWVRTLRGDRLTAEQGLQTRPAALSAQLGESHPYVRTIRLALAATLEARKALDAGATLRADADRATRQLFPYVWRDAAFDNDPTPPGVIAHLAPNNAELEGFRRQGAVFFAPMVNAQKEMADRQGWRLWIAASGSCRVSIVSGKTPQLLAVDTSRTTDGGWRISLRGPSPSLSLDAPASDRLLLGIAADSSNQLSVRLGASPARHVPMGAPADTPTPFGLSFSEPDTAGSCSVVWLEIPFPGNLGFRQR